MMAPYPKIIKRLSDLFIGVMLLGLTVFAVVAILGEVSLKGVDLWAVAGMAVLGLVATAVALYMDDDRPQTLADLMQPGKLARVLMALLFSGGLIISVYQIIAPSPVVESKPGLFETLLGDIRKEQGEQTAMLKQVTAAVAPDQAPVREILPGIWGNEDCSAVFEFKLTGDVVTVRSLRQPDSAKPYEAVASVITAKGLVIKTQNESDDVVTTLQVTPANTVPKLTWRNGDKPAVTLERCPA